MAGMPGVPRKLSKADVWEGFDSGAPELDDWLLRCSWQNQRANNAVTYVSVLDERVVGYYTVTVANVTSEAAPAPVARGAPRQVPCLLLARLAVDRRMQGLGLGRGLLADAMRCDGRSASPTPSASGSCWCTRATTPPAGSTWRRPSSWSRPRTRCTCSRR